METWHISNANLSPEERLRQLLQTELVQEGGDPSRFLSSLAFAVEGKVWERLGLKSFAEFVMDEKGLGRDPKDIHTLVSLRHRLEGMDAEMTERMANLRRTVRDELNPELPAWGEIGAGRRRVGIINSNPGGTDAGYTLRRLKRDNPALAEKVLSGELSANAAAIQAGFRRKTITIPHDPQRAAEAILRHFTSDEVDALMAALGERA